MKTTLKLLLPILIIGLLISPKYGLATYAVTVGQTFTYDSVKAEQDITIGSNTAHAEGYTIDGEHFDPGTSVDVEVTAVGASVDYDITAGGFTESDSSSTMGFMIGAIFTIILPILILAVYTDEAEWNQTAAEEDPGMMLSPFVENDTSIWDEFKDMATEIQTSFTSEPFDTVIINATYTDDVNNFLFEYYMAGNLDFNLTVTDGIVFIDADIEHHFQFAFQKATGVMLGIRLEGTVEGTSNSTVIDVSYKFHTELEGYNLPNYKFGGGWTWPFPGFELYIALGALSFIIIAAILIRKKH